MAAMNPGLARRPALTVVFTAAMVALCAVCFVYQLNIRLFEARAAAGLIGLFGTTGVEGTVVYAWLDQRYAIGLDITSSCTVALLGLPVLLAAVVLGWLRGVGKPRLVAAIALGLGVVFLGNQIRLLAIAFATKWWGVNFGFDFAHQIIGSLISLLTACLGVGAVIWFGTKGNSSRSRRSY